MNEKLAGIIVYFILLVLSLANYVIFPVFFPGSRDWVKIFPGFPSS